MDINEVKIVADSSADMLELEGINFQSAPLKISTDIQDYIDNKNLDVEAMANDLYSYKGTSRSSCPSPDDWMSAFGDAKYIFCVAITSGLSGSYNAACCAKDMYEEAHPERKVFVLDSLSAGPELTLVVEKIKELVLEGNDFDEVVQKTQDYSRKTGLFFMLESLNNFANNGRINPFIAKAVGVLGIRMVGKASDQGTLQPLDKCRGEKKALATIVDHLKEHGLNKGRVKIHHCFNLEAAQKLKDLILERFGEISVHIAECRGLCTFYAEKGGLLVGYERF